MIYECVIEIVSDDIWTTKAVFSQDSSAKCYEQIVKSIIYALSKILHVIQETKLKSALKVDISRENWSSFVSWFYAEHGIIGMLDALHIK